MSELLELAQRVAGWANDGEQVEAYALRSRDTEVRAFNGDVESLSSAESMGIGVRVVANGKQGFAYAGSLEPSALEEVLADARDNATFAGADEWVGLPTPDGVPAPELDIFRDDLEHVPTQRKVDLALEVERAALAADSRVTSVQTAAYADSQIEVAVASTAGVRASSRRTACYVAVEPLAADGDEAQTGFGFSVGRRPDDLDVDRAAADAADRATRLLGATKPKSGRVTVVLDPFVTAQLLGVLAATLNGESVLKGRSLFANRIGEQVAAPGVTLVDDPLDDRAYGASPFDAEGLACRPNRLVEAGVLQGFLHDSYTARRSGGASTGSAVRQGFMSTPSPGARAVSLAPGTRNQDELLADVGDAFLVQSVSGLHSGVNPVSGDFSVGAEGVLVRGGQRGAPVREVTIASTLQRMLLDIAAVGSDVDWLPMSAAGVSLVITDITMSGG